MELVLLGLFADVPEVFVFRGLQHLLGLLGVELLSVVAIGQMILFEPISAPVAYLRHQLRRLIHVVV